MLCLGVPSLLHWPSNTSNAGDRVRSCSWCQGWENCQSPLRNERGGDGRRQLGLGLMLPVGCCWGHSRAMLGCGRAVPVPPGHCCHSRALALVRSAGCWMQAVPHAILYRQEHLLQLACAVAFHAFCPCLIPIILMLWCLSTLFWPALSDTRTQLPQAPAAGSQV